MVSKSLFAAVVYAVIACANAAPAPPGGGQVQEPFSLPEVTGSANAPSPTVEAISTVTRATAVVQFPVKTSKPEIVPIFNRSLDRRGRSSRPPFPQPNLKLANITSPGPMRDANFFKRIGEKVLGEDRVNAARDVVERVTRRDRTDGPPPIPPRPGHVQQHFRPRRSSSCSSSSSSSCDDGPPPIPPRPHERRQETSGGIFAPIDTSAPLGMFPKRGDHQVPRQGIINDGDRPLQTNKFYSNFFLGNRDHGTWTMPYMLWWQKGTGIGSWGLAVSHVEPEQRAYGPADSMGSVQYYINPIRIQYFTFGATEFGNGMDLRIDAMKQMSANVHLLANGNDRSNRKITFPLTQGMGFVTGLYTNLTPRFESAVMFRSVERVTTFNRPGMTKYKLLLEDGRTWLLYLTRTDASHSHAQNSGPVMLSLHSQRRLQGSELFTGIAQLTKLPPGANEGVFDAAAGVYAAGVTLTGDVSGSTGSYSFQFHRKGISGSSAILQYALPHHIDSMTSGGRTDIRIVSTTKGTMTAVVSDTWTFREPDLPVNIGFHPVNALGATAAYSPGTIAKIASAAMSDMNQNMTYQTDLDSMYFSGKAFSKFATICWVLSDIVQDRTATHSCLDKLKHNFQKFLANQQKYPLLYDTAWKGLISSSAFRNNNDLNTDFGNPAYNDHHFHYGYHVHAAAVIAYIDRRNGWGDGWLNQHRQYINQLVRDFSNPSENDPYFPVSRAFDWFAGHSWAKGLFESADGKDQESSSEDAFCSYALKLWGAVSGNSAIEKRASLMLGIQKRSFNAYFLMSSSNKNHPPQFIGNKVTGILFENKVDHVTYFGAEREKIQGIHMIPLTPISTYIRSVSFIREEWDRWFRSYVAGMNDGWRGIVMANWAIAEPREGWAFFAQNGFRNEWLDGGASLSWYLTWAAGLGGAQ